MKIRKWIDASQEIEVDIGADDIRAALAEACGVVNRTRPGDGPSRQDILIALNNIGAFLRAITDNQISMLTFGQRSTVWKFLREHSERFQISEEFPQTPAKSSVAPEAAQS
jgi:hypothetical protein